MPASFSNPEALILACGTRFPVSGGPCAAFVARRHVSGWFEATVQEAACTNRRRPSGPRCDQITDGSGRVTLHPASMLEPPPVGPSTTFTYVIPGMRGTSRIPVAEFGTSFRRAPTTCPMSHVTNVVRRLVTGGDDPFLPHLVSQLAARGRCGGCRELRARKRGRSCVPLHLFDLLQRGGRLGFLTGDYRGITEPDALLRLLDLEGNIEFRVFETGTAREPVAALPIPARSFHPKAYIFRHANDGMRAFVGSSNLSASALATKASSGTIEIHFVARSRWVLSEETLAAFDSLFRLECTKPLTVDWVTEYRNRRPVHKPIIEAADIQTEAPKPPVFPTQVKEEALKALEDTRTAGNRAGLVVAWRPVSGKPGCQRSTQKVGEFS